MTLMHKPATIIGAGCRAGTARAQMQLHEALGENGVLVMVKTGLQVWRLRTNNLIQMSI